LAVSESVIRQFFEIYSGISMDPFEENGVVLAIQIAEELKARGASTRPRLEIRLGPNGLEVALRSCGCVTEIRVSPGQSWAHVPGALVGGLTCRSGEVPK
jgi:hypothetical protein